MSPSTPTTYKNHSEQPTDTNDQSNTNDTNATTERTDTCPECNGSVTSSGNEYLCDDCGLVIDEDTIDHGPEWRAYTSDERSKKSRTGGPSTKMLHDEGLSTNIDWRNKDSYGNALSSRKRQQMRRLRKWNERFRTQDSRERALRFALGEINRMASALGIPQDTREIASMIYRRAHEEELLPGRSHEGISTAAVYIAARQKRMARSLDEVTKVSRVERDEIRRAVTYLQQELSLKVPPARGHQFLPRFSNELEISDETQQWAKRFLDLAYDTGVASGKPAKCLAAAAIYAATIQTDEKLTQDDIKEVANVSNVTVRNRYKELHDMYRDHGEKQFVHYND